MFLEAKKIHFRCAVYVVVWVDQPSGMYRVCGVRSVAPGDHHRCDLKRKNSWPLWGFGELLLTYMIVNRALILEILIGNSSYVSHREEMISSATPFFETFRSVFLNSSQHAPSLHKYLILPIILFLILGAFCKKEETDRILYKAAVINFLFLIAIALFYAFCHLTAVVDWKNNATGFCIIFRCTVSTGCTRQHGIWSSHGQRQCYGEQKCHIRMCGCRRESLRSF